MRRSVLTRLRVLWDGAVLSVFGVPFLSLLLVLDEGWTGYRWGLLAMMLFLAALWDKGIPRALLKWAVYMALTFLWGWALSGTVARCLGAEGQALFEQTVMSQALVWHSFLLPVGLLVSSKSLPSDGEKTLRIIQDVVLPVTACVILVGLVGLELTLKPHG